jgi:hypothetical protein
MNPLVNSSVPGGNQTETSEGSPSVSAGIDDAFCWNVRPSDKEPTKKWGVLAAAVIAFALGLLLFKNVWFGFIGFIAILSATAEFWLGISYKIDPRAASSRCGLSLTSLEWSEVKRATATPEGIKLSPLGTTGRLEAFRGVFLRYGANRDKVTETVRRWLPTNVELMG